VFVFASLLSGLMIAYYNRESKLSWFFDFIQFEEVKQKKLHANLCL
jgi:hypothetical protein